MVKVYMIQKKSPPELVMTESVMENGLKKGHEEMCCDGGQYNQRQLAREVTGGIKRLSKRVVLEQLYQTLPRLPLDERGYDSAELYLQEAPSIPN